MEYLEGAKGLVTLNREGLPITLSVGNRVQLADVRGHRIFGESWEYGGEQKESWRTFQVDQLIDNAIILDGGDFHFILAVETGLPEPVITVCDGMEYSNDRILTVEFPNGCTNFVITPRYLLPD